MKASEFDNDRSLMDELDLSRARLSRARRPEKRQSASMSIFPARVVAALDRKARPLGVTRQSITRIWLAEHVLRSTKYGHHAANDHCNVTLIWLARDNQYTTLSLARR
jgi:hypothetical protein